MYERGPAAACPRHRRGPRGGRVDGHRRPRAEPPRRRARRHRAARARSRRAPGLPARGRPLRRARRQAAAPDFPAAGRHQPLPAHAGRDGGLHGRPARAAQRALPRPHHRGLRSARAGRAAAAPRPAQRRRGADAARTSAGARGGAHAGRGGRAGGHAGVGPLELAPRRLRRAGQPRRRPHRGAAAGALHRRARGHRRVDRRQPQLPRPRGARDGLPQPGRGDVPAASGSPAT